MNIVNFDQGKLKKFKKAYHRALSQKAEAFTFEGNDYLVDYAKYLIEYLKSRL